MSNPLSNYFRKPEIYVKLPSQGRWYPPNTLQMNDQGEVGVMPMTARDELIIRTPDALLNGQATVDVIKSCVPDIKDPWQMPAMDLDSILLGLRIASYGENVEFTTSNSGIIQEIKVNLPQLMTMVGSGGYNDTVTISNGLTIITKPIDYRGVTKSALRTYEEQRLMKTVTDSDLSEGDKIEKFSKIFAGLSDLTVNTMANMIVEVRPVEGDPVVNPVHIKEFVYNMDTKIADEIRNHIESNNKIGGIPPITVASTEEQLKAGAPKTYTANVSFDNSNFFVSRSSRSQNLR